MAALPWSVNPWSSQLPRTQAWAPVQTTNHVLPLTQTAPAAVGTSVLSPLTLMVGSNTNQAATAASHLLGAADGSLKQVPAASGFNTNNFDQILNLLGRGSATVTVPNGKALVTRGKFGDCDFMTASGTQTAFATGLDWSEPSSYFDERGNLIDAFEPNLRDRNYGYFELDPQLVNGLPAEVAEAERAAALKNGNLAHEAALVDHTAKVLAGWYLPSVFDLGQSEPNFPNILLEFILEKRPDSEPPFAFVHKVILILRIRHTELIATLPYIQDSREALANYRVAEIMDIVIEDLKLLYYFHKNQLSNNAVKMSGEYQSLAYLTANWRTFVLKMLDAAANSKMNKVSPLQASRLCCDDDSLAWLALLEILPNLTGNFLPIAPGAMNPYLLPIFRNFWKNGQWDYAAWQAYMNQLHGGGGFHPIPIGPGPVFPMPPGPPGPPFIPPVNPAVPTTTTSTTTTTTTTTTTAAPTTLPDIPSAFPVMPGPIIGAGALRGL